MKEEAWLNRVEENKGVLRRLIERYHPMNLKRHAPEEAMAPNITAPNAERTCELFREQIRAFSLDCPEVQFDIALAKRDYITITKLLEQTWIGVPESTDSWRIEGFSIAVDLLDDPVEEDEYEESEGVDK